MYELRGEYVEKPSQRFDPRSRCSDVPKDERIRAGLKRKITHMYYKYSRNNLTLS